jgi:integrase
VTNPHLALVAPTTVIGTVGDHPNPPRRKRNAEVRAREYLTDGEIARLVAAASGNRHGHRDASMVLVAYRHGLRAAELVTLRWDAIDFAHGRLHVRRLKGGSEAVHPLSAGSCGPCAGLRGSKSLIHRSFSRLNGERRSRPRGFVRWLRGLGLPPISVSRFIRTC